TKRRIFEILDIASSEDLPSKIFDLFIMTLISLNVIAVVLETVKSLASKYSDFFTTFEVISVVVFTLEYVLRLWTCTSKKEFSKSVVGRIRFALTPIVLIDLMAILPFYLPMLIKLDLRFLRALRLFRLFRMFKLARYSESMQTLGYVFREKKEELIITIFAVLLLLVFTSSLMYFIENQGQPDAFSSIPAAMWWGVATLTTVGYGDIYPLTPIGKLLGAMIAILGVGLFALPAGILASGFASVIQKRQSGRICPHCGKTIDTLPNLKA
ncbi:MAG: ion transporter, partial [bacterium]